MKKTLLILLLLALVALVVAAPVGAEGPFQAGTDDCHGDGCVPPPGWCVDGPQPNQGGCAPPSPGPGDPTVP